MSDESENIPQPEKTALQILHGQMEELGLNEDDSQALLALDNDILQMVLNSKNWHSFCMSLAQENPKMNMVQVEATYGCVRRFLNAKNRRELEQRNSRDEIGRVLGA